MADKFKRKVRALQAQTGWSYMECRQALLGPPPEMNMLDPKNRATAERWTKAVAELEAAGKKPG